MTELGQEEIRLIADKDLVEMVTSIQLDGGDEFILVVKANCDIIIIRVNIDSFV